MKEVGTLKDLTGTETGGERAEIASLDEHGRQRHLDGCDPSWINEV